MRSATYGFGSLSGIMGGPVGERSALGVASFFWAVNFIASIKASLPFEVQERQGESDNWSTIFTHPTAWLLNNQPNPNRTAISAHHERLVHCLVNGRSTSILRLDPVTADPVSIWPIHPSSWGPLDDTRAGRIYTAALRDGEERLDTSQVIDITSTTIDGGLTVLSPLRLFETQLGLARALTGHAQSFWENNPRPGIIVTTPSVLDDEQFATFQRRLNEGYRGDNAGKAMVLDGGLSANPWQMTFADYQLLEMLSAVDNQVGRRIFNMPPDDLKDDAWGRYFVDFTLRPWIERDDQEMTIKLLPYSSRGRYRIWTRTSDLNRGDLRSRADIAQRGMLASFTTKNEARRLLNLPPVADGDKFMVAQSVFGGQGGKVTGGDNPSASQNSRQADGDPVTEGLLSDAIAGIFSRTRHQLAKPISSTDWEARVGAHFTDQQSLARKRLRMLPTAAAETLVSVLAEQREELRGLTSLDPEQRSSRLNSLADGWESRVPEIVRSLTARN